MSVPSRRGYRKSYFRNLNKNGNPFDDEEYANDLEDYEDFEMLTKKFINNERNILDEKSEELLNS